MNSQPSSSLSDVVGAAVAVHDFEAAFQAINGHVMASRVVADAVHGENLSFNLNTRGWLHLQLGRYAEALADCREARRMNPNLDQNNLKLARLFNDYYESVIKPEMVRLQGGISAEPASNIAMAYYQTGFYANAASYLHIAISVADPSEVGALYNTLSGAYLGSGLVIDAVRAAAKAIALTPETDRTNYLLALHQIKAVGQDPGVLLQDIPPVPESTDAAAATPQAEVAGAAVGGDYTAALTNLTPRVDAAIAKVGAGGAAANSAASEEAAGLLHERGRYHLNLHNFDEAVADFREARRHSLHLGHEDLRLAQFFKAEYDRSLKPLFDKLHAGICAETYNELGLLFFKNGFATSAVIYFQLAVPISEGLVRAESLNNLAGAYIDSQYVIEALRAATQANVLNPRISKVNLNLASTLLKPARIDLDTVLKDRFATLRTVH